jgi:hypothetical protein
MQNVHDQTKRLKCSGKVAYFEGMGGADSIFTTIWKEENSRKAWA